MKRKTLQQKKEKKYKKAAKKERKKERIIYFFKKPHIYAMHKQKIKFRKRSFERNCLVGVMGTERNEKCE